MENMDYIFFVDRNEELKKSKKVPVKKVSWVKKAKEGNYFITTFEGEGELLLASSVVSDIMKGLYFVTNPSAFAYYFKFFDCYGLEKG